MFPITQYHFWYTNAGRAFGLGYFRHFASVLDPRHIEMRPKGGTFGLDCKGTGAIEGLFCFGYVRTRAIFTHQLQLLSATAPPTCNNAQNNSVSAQSTMEGLNAINGGRGGGTRCWEGFTLDLVSGGGGFVGWESVVAFGEYRGRPTTTDPSLPSSPMRDRGGSLLACPHDSADLPHGCTTLPAGDYINDSNCRRRPHHSSPILDPLLPRERKVPKTLRLVTMRPSLLHSRNHTRPHSRGKIVFLKGLKIKGRKRKSTHTWTRGEKFRLAAAGRERKELQRREEEEGGSPNWNPK